jgi:hypothetical protein
MLSIINFQGYTQHEWQVQFMLNLLRNLVESITNNILFYDKQLLI